MKHLFFISLMMLSTIAMAETVSQSEALSKAQNFLKSRNSSYTRANEPLTLVHQAGSSNETYYYVFNHSAGGFIIIGGDDAAREILGYSDKGSFDLTTLPDNMRWLLTEYETQISHAIRAIKNGAKPIYPQGHTRASKPDVMPLLGEGSNAIEWSQQSPYNLGINKYRSSTDTKYYTGCVPTATAQVMRYYQHPAKDMGLRFPEIDLKYGGTAPAIASDFSYNWTNMKPQYSSDSYSYTDPDVYDLANLMYRLGRSVDATYRNPGNPENRGTSSSPRKMAESLMMHFGYDRSIFDANREFYSDSQWEDLIYGEVASGRPVIYTAHDERSTELYSEHSFVCDGYLASTDTYHINWGRGGHDNGYFAITGSNALSIPSLDHYYTSDHQAIINIKPDAGGDYVRMLSASPFTITSTTLLPNSRIEIASGKILNTSYVALSVGAIFVDTADPSKTFVSPESNVLNPFYTRKHFTMHRDLEVGHSYYFYPAFQDAYGVWQKCQMSDDSAVPVITVDNATELMITDITLKYGAYFTPDELSIDFTLSNFTGSDLPYEVRMLIYEKDTYDNPEYRYEIPAGTLADKETKTFSVTLNDLVRYSTSTHPFAADQDYRIRFRNVPAKKNYNITEYIYCRARTTIDWELSTTGWGTLCLPFEAAVPAGLTAYTVTDISGSVIVKTEASKLEANKPYLINGAAGTYTFTGPLTPDGTFVNGLLYGVTTVPSYGANYAPAGSYVLQNNATGLGFYLVDGYNSQEIRPYTAYLKPESSVFENPFVSIYPIEVGLEEIKIEEKETKGMTYNLMGQPMTNCKGLVIKNGKLYFVK